MLVKTKGPEISKGGHPVMLTKTSALLFLPRDADDKKDSYERSGAAYCHPLRSFRVRQLAGAGFTPIPPGRGNGRSFEIPGATSR
jgi:hypothetical protein